MFVRRNKNMEKLKKVNWRKIIIFIFLFGCISFLKIVPAVYIYKCPGCSAIEYHSFWLTLFGHGIKSLMPISVMILEILISYALTCFIVIIWNKLKK